MHDIDGCWFNQVIFIIDLINNLALNLVNSINQDLYICVCVRVYIYIYIYKILVLYKWLTCNDMVQTEGAGDEGGRGPSTWDRFIQDGVGDKDIAVDSYNHYKVYMNIVT